MIHQLTDRLQGAGIGVHRLSAADEQEIQRLGGDTAAVHAWLPCPVPTGGYGMKAAAS